MRPEPPASPSNAAPPAAPATGALPAAAAHAPRGTPRASRRARWRAAALILVHVAFFVHLAHWRRAGSTLSPVEPSEAGQTLEFGYVNAGFVMLAVSVLTTLVFGRFFCGWACHVVAYQDLCAALLAKLGLRPRPVRSRLLALGPFVAAALVFGAPLARRLGSGAGWPDFVPHFRSGDFWATFPGWWIGGLTLAVDGFLVVWILGSKAFCTYGCPYGAFFGVADRFAKTRIRVTDACEGCGHCTAVCTSNVRVHAEVAKFGAVVDPGCLKCMDCVSVCPKDALYLGRASSGRAAERFARTPRWQRRPTRTWDFSWPEELALAALFALGLFAFRGLYNSVSLMLALGLAVLLAFAGVVLARALTRPELSVQGRVWRSAGRFTRAGLAGTGALALFALFGSHSAAVQLEAGRGERALELARDAQGAPREAAIAASRVHLERARRLGLFGDSAVENQLGQIASASGDWERAARHFERALELRPAMRAPRMQLAEVELRRGRPEAAEAAWRALVLEHPDDEAALRKLADFYLLGEPRLEAALPILEQLAELRPDDLQVRENLARTRALLGR